MNWNRRLWTIFLLCLCLSPYQWHPAVQSSSVKLCGKRFIRTLEFICKGCFTGGATNTKRSWHSWLTDPDRGGGGVDEHDFLDGAEVVMNEDGEMVVENDGRGMMGEGGERMYWKGGMMGKRTTTERMGPASQCCRRKCKFSQLRKFCCTESERKQIKGD